MSQQDLDRRVAAATGEGLGTIRRRGFSVMTTDLPGDSDCGPPQSIDWDSVAALGSEDAFPRRLRAA